MGYPGRHTHGWLAIITPPRGTAPSCRIRGIPIVFPFRVRTIRLLLLVLMLAYMPFQAWAGTAVHVSDAASCVTQHADNQRAGLCAAVEDTAPGGTASADVAEAAESSPLGADLAEQLLPAPQLRVVAGSAQSGLPRYAGAALPDPDLPLLPRPPRG
ncbi:hypothetical protein LMG23994_01948 [Cupriavidus pinatubonensis]|uniref:Uncharacterized protein n=1 Tax=Cupriavidus pinatubonensis TaxID=248026 RepID=A0ABN7YE67_9BURK|nr:hypothetical protein LMG23994_01948 [Cupriavidus pinatubonensis]